VAAHFTDRELDIMKVLWAQGASTVTEVREHLDEDLAYTTVLTILRTLEAKGHVDHEEEGKAHRYRATVTQAAARGSALSKLVDRVFGGSAELLLTHLVKDRKLTAAEVRRLRAVIDRQASKGKTP
jgi:predicted transcriptional regulator